MKFLLNTNKLFFISFLISLILFTSTHSMQNNKLLIKKQIVENNNKLKKSYNDIPYVSNSLSRIYRYSAQNPDENTKKSSLFDKLIKLMSLYLQFFFVLSIISFHKWYEDMIKIKCNYIENKYSMFKDLTTEKNKIRLPSEYEGYYVFISGSTVILEKAKDPKFEFGLNESYAVLERKVEYFDINTSKWQRFGYITHRDETSDEVLDVNIPDVTFLNDKLMQISFNGEIFTFPRIISKINKIELNTQQLKKLSIYDTIKIPEDFSYEKLTPEEGFKRIEYNIDKEFIYISPCDIERDISKTLSCKLRVSFRGYQCEKVSIMALVKNGSFKTIHIPYHYKEDEESEKTTFINQSSSMVVVPNFNFDICNILFCFCFSGPATYNHTDEISNDPSSNISSINWILENAMTKNEMTYQKHHIKRLNFFLTRLTVFLFLISAFYLMPETLIITLKVFGFNPDFIKNHLKEFALILATIIISSVYFFSLISYKVKHIINMFIISFLIVLLILLVIKQILNMV